ncbi:MAG: 5'-methylthioadenosine/S-adenosylhomocysteine nucleosidase family protein, partial [Acidimicrobiales bacterium]
MRWRSALAAAALLAVLGNLVTVRSVGETTSAAAPAPAGATCAQRVLVLSAMPLEADPILAQAKIDPGSQVDVNHHSFVTATLEGVPVVIGITGIGPVNAAATTTDALSQFSCAGISEIAGVAFSGTSGGDYIGDVFVPTNWTLDGVNFYPNSPTLLGVAQQAVAAGRVKLIATTPTGDPGCACTVSDGVMTPVKVTHTPHVEFAAVGKTTSGLTTDPFDGMALPCVAAGSDIFGCTPCRELDAGALAQASYFATAVVPFLEPQWMLAY